MLFPLRSLLENTSKLHSYLHRQLTTVGAILKKMSLRQLTTEKEKLSAVNYRGLSFLAIP